jgi:hypothetical protein
MRRKRNPSSKRGRLLSRNSAIETGNSLVYRESVDHLSQQSSSTPTIMPKKKDATAPEPSKEVITKILTRLMEGHKSGKGCGAADADTCRQLVMDCDKWSNFDWMNMGMQLGILQ